MTNDTCCTIVPYFKIHEGKSAEFHSLCEAFVERTQSETKCLYYGFSFDGDHAHCREGYIDADGLLNHLTNVGDLLEKALGIADVERLEVHGPAEELEKLKGPLAELNPQYFELQYGFRKA